MAGPSNNDEEKKVVSLRQEGSLIPRRHDPGRTLLPGPLASVISLATKSSSVSLQIGTFIARRIIDGARVTSLTSLDLTRAAVESILLSAGHDVISRTRGELGKMEAEGLLEHSVCPCLPTVYAVIELTDRYCLDGLPTFWVNSSGFLSGDGLSCILCDGVICFSAVAACTYLTGLDPGLNRVLKGHRFYHHPNPTGISQSNDRSEGGKGRIDGSTGWGCWTGPVTTMGP